MSLKPRQAFAVQDPLTDADFSWLLFKFQIQPASLQKSGFRDYRNGGEIITQKVAQTLPSLS